MPGATVEFLGEDRREPAPVTFDDLDPDREYELRITHPNHLDREVVARPGGDPLVVTLDPLPRVLMIRSRPPGAAVAINGEDKGATPTEVVLDEDLARAERLEIALRRPGFEPSTRVVGADAEFEVDGEREVHEVRVALERTAPASPRQRRPEPAERGDEDGDRDGDGDGDEAPAAEESAPPAAEEPAPPAAEEPAPPAAEEPTPEPREIEDLTRRPAGGPDDSDG